MNPLHIFNNKRINDNSKNWVLIIIWLAANILGDSSLAKLKSVSNTPPMLI